MWMTPKIRPRRPGREGLIVFLVDVSGSISKFDANKIRSACEEARPYYDGLRFFAWALEVVEVPWQKRLFGKHEYPDLYDRPFRDGRTISTMAGGGNDLPKVLRAIAPLKPSKTVILSDGIEDNTTACQECLAVVDGMTGDVDAFCTFPVSADLSRWDGNVGAGFMAELARRGGGRFVSSHQSDLRFEAIQSIQFVRQRRFHHHQLPDQHIYLGRRG